jgi:branched-subunit amino acid aminotransferase/4-amino-4-deoxychorismate lyase
MVVCYNSQLLKEEELQLPLSNRAFQYNDGAFETMLFINGKVRFLEDHLNRLQRTAEVLSLELPQALFELETVAFSLQKLLDANQLQGNIRIKLKLWRSGNGLYTPDQNTAEVLITAEPQIASSNVIEKADFANSGRTHYSAYSFFKGPNSIQYVLAGIEKNQRNLDEIILLSADGFVSECLASNIFWVKNEIVFTPEIETGCVAGIMRENILRVFQAESIPFQEGKFLPEELCGADVVFTSNAAGIRIFGNIQNKTFKTDHHILNMILDRF